MQENNLTETHSLYEDWTNYKPPKFFAILQTPMNKSIYSL